MASMSHRRPWFSPHQYCILFILSCCLIIFFFHHKNIGLKVTDWTKSGILSVISSHHHYTYINLDLVRTERMFERTIVDDYNKVIYCPLTKVASTSWKTALLEIQSCRNSSINLPMIIKRGVHPHSSARMAGLKFLSDFTPEEARFRLETYFKFIFKRHPLDRLVSAYRDKFQKPTDKKNKQFHLRYGRDIVKRYRNSPAESALKSGSDVTFVEFVRFVIDRYNAGETLNNHWATMGTLCDPYDIHYDYIGAFENLADDFEYVAGIIHDDQCDVQLPISPGSSQKEIVPTLLTLEYISLLNRQQLCTIIEIYKADFEYFQYDSYDIDCHALCI